MNDSKVYRIFGSFEGVLRSILTEAENVDQALNKVRAALPGVEIQNVNEEIGGKIVA